MTRNVTVGLDGSPESRAAAAWAAQEALLREVPLHLVHAEEWPTTAAIPMVGPEVQQQWADKVLADAADELRQRHPGLEITARRLSGRPAAALPIEAGDAEMLVLGSRGLGSIMGFLIGSVGMATVSATEQPVVLVRAPKHQDKEPRARSGGAEQLTPRPRTATWSSAWTSTSPATSSWPSPSTRPHGVAALSAPYTAGRSPSCSATHRCSTPASSWKWAGKSSGPSATCCCHGGRSSRRCRLSSGLSSVRLRSSWCTRRPTPIWWSSAGASAGLPWVGTSAPSPTR